ncbi:hypothetical protein GCM10007424_23860 [Flavobacterium suaedae]|uniref:Uncharacterized protein n=1 Tax=Flavobacterium suaedae TaxID=1767027 RepID=A0ABQ1K395_9FLAO|nr:hypothetical protein [Flavobacterium suaedae]GGB83065.1 hypothetical protein GCM10007424_23860 [Flavobacterium suaedae]
MAKQTGIQLTDDANTGTVLDLKVQPKYDASGKIISGLVIGNTLEQNKALILLMKPGDLKSKPDLGVGLEDMLLSDNYLEFRHRIREHFAKDGLTVTRLDLYENKPIVIQANYDS